MTHMLKPKWFRIGDNGAKYKTLGHTMNKNADMTFAFTVDKVSIVDVSSLNCLLCVDWIIGMSL